MDRPPGLLYVGVFAVALASGLLLTPWARRFAVRLGVLDIPRGSAQVEPVALLGGLTLYGAAFVSGWLAVPGARRELAGLFLAGLVVVVVGLRDDVAAMDPWPKLLAQATAALVLVSSGVQVRIVDHPVVDAALTVLWIVAVINAVNLQDNMNGLAAGLAAVSCLGLFALAYGDGQWAVAVAAVGVAGGVLGFLPSNWPRARIFMGDAGSMFLGLVLAFLTLRLHFFRWPRTSTFLIPVLALAVPLFDTALVTVCRLRRGSPVTRGGQDHSSHRLVCLGLTARVAVAVLWGAQAACCLAAVAVAQLGRPVDLVTAAVGVVAAGLGAVGLGRAIPTTGPSTRNDDRPAERRQPVTSCSSLAPQTPLPGRRRPAPPTWLLRRSHERLGRRRPRPAAVARPRPPEAC